MAGLPSPGRGGRSDHEQPFNGDRSRVCGRVDRVFLEAAANLIGAVPTKGGLSIQTELDENAYAAGGKVTDTPGRSRA